MDRILVLNLTRMGDILQSAPLISGLRKRHPQAEIGLLVQQAFVSAAHLLPHVDRVLTLDQDQAVGLLMDDRIPLGRQAGWFHSQVRLLRGEGWDLVINLSHSRDSAVLARQLGRGEVRGIVLQDDGRMGVAHDWARYFFCVTGNRAVNQLNLVDIYRLMGGLGASDGELDMRIPSEALQTVAALLTELGKGPLVLIQAGASRENRRWPVNRMAQVMRELHDSTGAVFALTGSAGETELCRDLAALAAGLPVINLAGRTGLEELGALCRHARLLITNDTGTLHVAAANGLPSVSLFIATALPWETAPWLSGCLVLHPDMTCAPCSHHVQCPHIQCREAIPVESVRDAALELLHRQELGPPPSKKWADRAGVRVFETCRDGLGWLDLREHGQREADDVYHTGRAFRHLWLARLGEESPSRRGPASPQDLPSFDSLALPLGELGAALDGLAREAMRGQHLVEEIHRELAGRPTRAARLEVLTQRLMKVDDLLFELELGQPLLRPLGVLHRLAKEHQQDTGELEELGRRTAALYAEFAARTKELKMLLVQAERGSRHAPDTPAAADVEGEAACRSW